MFPQTPFCHQSFPILSSGLTSLPSPSCNHHNPIADTMLARLGNNCDNRLFVNIYYLVSSISIISPSSGAGGDAAALVVGVVGIGR